MEKMLMKIARQLESLDEASLMSLWSKYATLANRFEPTKRWEEACLIFSLIQAKHWKNQLFNYCWSQQRMPPLKNAGQTPQEDLEFSFSLEPEQEEKTQCRILTFRPLPEDTENRGG